ncbi:GHMP kinase [Metallosphaera tengchongensis]|uniref:Pantoate kinase n=1 Tax=Metallosphaera tengchongensis TaxID=1532350 RepID=A0A6N0NZQ4_9CREN|nr:GHMP kinase [Metallosphaera tengchongensis]QKR00550.1 GHMP kinase [Metallosphaera tengchongensis]
MVDIVIPISVSGIWYPIDLEEPKKSGSIGLTLILEPFSYARVTQGEGIYLNGKLVKISNQEILQAKLGKLKVDLQSSVPLGYGYGMSASISIAYALGASELFSMNPDNAISVAHESEVVSGNGLGDVVSQYYGRNLVLRESPGVPPYGRITIFELESDQLYSKPIEAIPTRSILKPLKQALELIDEFKKSPSLQNFISCSRRFTEAMGFKSPYPDSIRKKGLILKLGSPESESWIRHKIANQGAFVE